MSHIVNGSTNLECVDEFCLSFIDTPLNPGLNFDCIKNIQSGYKYW